MTTPASLLHARPRRSRRLAARLWWATLPHAGMIGWPKGVGNPPRWYDYPLAWLNRLAEKLPGSEPFEPQPPIICTCDYCQGVPGAVFEP